MRTFENLTPAEQSKIELYRIRHGKYDEFLDSGEGILDEKRENSHKDQDDFLDEGFVCKTQEQCDQRDHLGSSVDSAVSKLIFNIGCLLGLYR